MNLLIERSRQQETCSGTALAPPGRELQNYVVREFLEGLYGMEDTLHNSAATPRGFEQALLGEFSPVRLANETQRAFAAGRRTLLIDQPEEDLDNEQIRAIADRIAETKHNRQLVFVSHNANIVVNGDAELVVRFDYTPSDKTKGIIDRTGSIDFPPIKNIITVVMEGGREAFELRRQKYGF
jgi:hypothetical protein